MARRSPLLVAVGLLGAVLAGCGDDAPPDDASGTSAAPAPTPTTGTTATTRSPTTSTSGAPPGGASPAPPTTAPATTTTAPSAVLPPDDRPRTPPADVTAELADVTPEADFEAFAGGVVQALQVRFPPGTPGQATDAAWAAAGDAGVVRFRVDGLADDSLAGWDYQVEATGAGGTWSVTSATRQAICRRGLAGDLCA